MWHVFKPILAPCPQHFCQPAHAVFQQQQPAVLFCRYLKRLRRFAPAPAIQIVGRHAGQPIGQPRGCRNAMWTSVGLETRGFDPAPADSRTQVKHRALRHPACIHLDDIRIWLETTGIVRALEVLLDLCSVTCSRHRTDHTRAMRRNLGTSRRIMSIAASISASLVKRPRLSRSELCAS